MFKRIILFVTIALLVPFMGISKEQPKKIRPAVPDEKTGKSEDKKKELKPAVTPIEYIKAEGISELIKKEANSQFERIKEVLKEEVKPKSEFETDEAYKKRLEGASAEMITKKIQLMEDAYKKRRLFGVKEMPLTLPQYNPEEGYFDIKIITLPLIDNVIYQPPEEETNLRFVPSENGVDLILRLKINPENARKLREKDKNLKSDIVFTIYISLKSQEDLNIYSVVAFSDISIYTKEKEQESSVYKRALRVNTPTFPKRD